MRPASRRILADRMREAFEVDAPSTSPLDDIFREQPVPLDTFLYDSILRYPKLSERQYDFARHFEQILNPETYVMMVQEWGPEWVPVRFVNRLTGVWGKGGGKDYICQLSFARLSYLLLCMKSPTAYYDLSPNAYIHLLNVAQSAPQAHRAFFKPLRALLTSTPWFEDKFEGDEPGPQAVEVRFRNQVQLISGHSEADSQEGLNLLAGMADEIDAFPVVDLSRSGKPPSKTADAVLEMLLTSASTRFPTQHKVALISYPRSKRGAILTALKQAEEDMDERGDQSRFYVSGPFATWDVNPRYDSIPRIEVPGALAPIPDVQTFKDDYKHNPAMARGKYECAPEEVHDRYFKDDAVLFSGFSQVDRAVPPVSVAYWYGINMEDGETLPQWQVSFSFAPDFQPVPGAIYAVHGDLALTGDRAGIAMSHVKRYENYETEQSVEQRPVVETDFIVALEADMASVSTDGQSIPREIQIRWFRKLVQQLISSGFYVGSVTLDGFQSADTLQILASQGVNTNRLSVDRDMVAYKTLKDLMYDGRFLTHWNDLCVSELQQLQRVNDKKIDHPPNGSKDLADALAGSVVGAIVLGGQEDTGGGADAFGSAGGAPVQDFDLFGSGSGVGWASGRTGGWAFGDLSALDFGSSGPI